MFKNLVQWNFSCLSCLNDQHWSAILFHVIGNRTMWFDCGIVSIVYFIQTHEHDLSQKVETYKRKAPNQRCFFYYDIQYKNFILLTYFVICSCVRQIFSIITSDICQENANAVVDGSRHIQFVSHINDENQALVLHI